MKYEERIVVFLDILGFKEIIDSTVDNDTFDNESSINNIVDLYELIYQNWDLPPAFGTGELKHSGLSLAKENAEKGKIVTVFSDSVVISFPKIAEGEIFWTLMEIRLLLLEFANRGVFCRGAVSFGKLIHTDKILFGPALVEAYLLESQKAIYPRVLVTESVLEEAKQPYAARHATDEELEYIHSLLSKDDDNYHYIDYFEKVQGELDDPEFGYCDYLLRVKDYIVTGLSNTDGRVKSKFEWLQKKFNITIAAICNEKVTANLLAQGRSDMVHYYSELTSI